MITATITLETRWHVGTGTEEPGRTDALTATQAGEPVIPGPTMKGLLRDRARFVGPVLGLDEHVITTVFGAKDSAGAWHFGTARSETPVWTGVATHHARDQETGVVPEDKLFDLELADPCQLVTLAAPREDHAPTDDEIALVAASFLALERLGARRRRGYGRCRTSIHIDGADATQVLHALIGDDR